MVSYLQQKEPVFHDICIVCSSTLELVITLFRNTITIGDINTKLMDASSSLCFVPPGFKHPFICFFFLQNNLHITTVNSIYQNSGVFCLNEVYF